MLHCAKISNLPFVTQVTGRHRV